MPALFLLIRVKDYIDGFILKGDVVGLPKNIVLIGAMGSGKSTVGKSLAEKIGYQFIDTDAELIKRTGVSISTIFDIEGEAGFRQRETGLLNDLLGFDGFVVGTGGGIILLEQNRPLLKKIGIVIYLSASEDILFERLEHCKDRPLLQKGDRRQAIRHHLKKRAPLYRQAANIEISTQRDSVKTMVGKLIKQLKSHESTYNY